MRTALCSGGPSALTAREDLQIAQLGRRAVHGKTNVIVDLYKEEGRGERCCMVVRGTAATREPRRDPTHSALPCTSPGEGRPTASPSSRGWWEKRERGGGRWLAALCPPAGMAR